MEDQNSFNTNTNDSQCFNWRRIVSPQAIDLIYWRDVKKSAAVFASSFLLLLSLALFSVLSVSSYLMLTTLTVAMSFRLYKNIMAAIQKTGEGNPFKKFLDINMNISDEKKQKYADLFFNYFFICLTELRRLFLVEDLVDSIKFGLLLWILTYLGAWFNAMTLLLIADVGIFTIPKFYETYQTQIDKYYYMAKDKFDEIMKKIKEQVERLPIAGKKKEE